MTGCPSLWGRYRYFAFPIQCAQFSEALVSRFATLLNGVPILMVQLHCIISCSDVHIISYEESSPSSADVSDEPKEDDEESNASKENVVHTHRKPTHHASHRACVSLRGETEYVIF